MKEGELYLSKYKILKVYKETSESCVLLAEHIQLNSYWIIKILYGVNDDTMREVEVLKGVKHPGIPLIIDVISKDNTLVMIREYIEGENLNEYSINGLSQEEIIGIGLKICHVLKFLHEELNRPLIFRDLKPGNIIMMKSGELKLIDFGIARFYKEESNHDTTYLGTKGFASPEQYGINQSDVRTDVFGLGATLYFLTTKSDLGKPPYRILPISNFRKDIDKAFEMILIKACEINKNKRFQTIGELETALSQLVKVEEVEQNWEDNLKSLKLSVIGFSGLKSGSGTTYTAMRAARFLASNNIRTCIIDATKNENLMSLEFQDDVILSKGSLKYKGISIVNITQLNKDSKKTMLKRFEDFQVVIIDFGKFNCHHYLEFRNSFDTSKKVYHYLVTRVSPWEIELFEEFIFSNDYDKYLKIIINGCTKGRFNAIQKSLEDVGLTFMPYETLEILDSEDQFCTKLFKEMEEIDHWLKKKSFLNLNYYKIKLLNRIK